MTEARTINATALAGSQAPASGVCGCHCSHVDERECNPGCADLLPRVDLTPVFIEPRIRKARLR